MASALPLNTRRTFVKSASLLAGSLLLPRLPTIAAEPDKFGPIMPTRPLGSTGLNVTTYCVGGHHIGDKTDAIAEASIDQAIKMGCRFWDTAESYQRGRSEEMLGKYMSPKYREHTIILTKTKGTDGETVKRHIQGSLDRLRTDYIDIYMLHSINTIADADSRVERGVYDVILEAKRAGQIKHIGFSGHVTPEANNHFLNKKLPEMEVMLCPVNVADPSYRSFILNTLPLAEKHGVGILAMKSLAGSGLLGGKSVWGRLRGQERPGIVPKMVSVKDAQQFALSYPVASLVAGHDDLDQLDANIITARDAVQMSEGQRQELINRVAEVASRGMNEHYKA